MMIGVCYDVSELEISRVECVFNRRCLDRFSGRLFVINSKALEFTDLNKTNIVDKEEVFSLR